MMPEIETDIVVIGAGLVGLAATVACAKLGKGVVLIDAKKTVIKKHQGWDERIYTLTANTQKWLQELGVWAAVDISRVNTINAMRLWNVQGSELVLQDSDANLSKLGMIIENQNLMQALWAQISALDVKVLSGSSCEGFKHTREAIKLELTDGSCINAKLILAADGTESWVRNQSNIAVKYKDFNQTAIVANFVATNPHRNTAQQWFKPHETLAFLPLPNQYVSLPKSLSSKKPLTKSCAST